MFSIHALLAESDPMPLIRFCPGTFLSTLSLRRATLLSTQNIQNFGISIHALLAESDGIKPILGKIDAIFYPRSPCGERPFIHSKQSKFWFFYPRSPCGERQQRPQRQHRWHSFSIHALLAESDSQSAHAPADAENFLSTLSLRRATNGHG